MINVEEGRVEVFGEVGLVMSEFVYLVNSLKLEHRVRGLTEEQTNKMMIGAFFKGITAEFEYEEKTHSEGSLTDDK